MASQTPDFMVIFVISCLGFITLCKPVFGFIKWVWVMFLRPPKNLRHHYCSWAVVTGCTVGIGKALAFQLASRSLNLLLVGRNPLKLEATANAIRLDIGVLVNNAGLSYEGPRFFHEVESEVVESIIKVTVEAATGITKAVVPIMEKKKKGVPPVLTLYTPFMLVRKCRCLTVFSRSISLEYNKTGIDIQCQIPSFVVRKMTKFRRSSLFIPSAETFSEASLRWIGYREHPCVPYWPHYFQCFLLKLLHDSFKNRCVFRYFTGIRKRKMMRDSRKLRPNINQKLTVNPRSDRDISQDRIDES
ncbi:hypothetical protein F3Y22_tig00003041pilonHSYRG01008 [Hibiscus syriacus]|uniref:Uncharacterized protein n=1 Tax=Hibiscus syriacus TaxID=106335 RepID=A0A6A3CSD4_HIBSY|nr:hypothetical protein F3Y22_tig00003041pilonHSYRG01008 [Hibiscus syriacus]